MSRQTSRTSLFLLALAVAMLLSAFAATAASAVVPGSTAKDAVELFVGSSVTTQLVPEPPPVPGGQITGKFYFKVALKKGQTFRAKYSTNSILNFKSFLWTPSGYENLISSVNPSAGMTILTWMAPADAGYTFYVGTSTTGTFTVTPQFVSPIYYTIKPMSAPYSAKPWRTFYVSTTLTPGYAVPTKTTPVKFLVQRKVSGVWKGYTTKSATISYRSTSCMTSRAALSLPKGTFRIRAAFKDAGHLTTRYNSYKTVYIKY